ncbi:hypothetical protein BJ546DRAFT_833947, partial [Cryomyces antarcticus]
GYVGGNTSSPLVKKHPEDQIMALVRSEAQGNTIQKAVPKVVTVVGDLDSSKTLQEAAAKADVVLDLASSDHVFAATSLIKGLSRRKGHFIHILGTEVLNDMSEGRENKPDKTYRDASLLDLEEIKAFDHSHIHWNVDKAIMQAGKENSVPTAVMCPPLTHGAGSGPINRRSIPIPILVESILKRGRGFRILEAQNVWDSKLHQMSLYIVCWANHTPDVHMDDISKAFVLPTEDALLSDASEATWG